MLSKNVELRLEKLKSTLLQYIALNVINCMLLHTKKYVGYKTFGRIF
jgi:hypothetical protein